MRLPVHNMAGEVVGEADLSDEVFGITPNAALMHQAMMIYMGNQRKGTAATKTRGMVAGGGHKPWKQKGTGRARSGSNRSPVWRKGGIVFGPRPHSHRESMPETKRRTALLEAIAAKYAGGAVLVIENLDIKEAKTKTLKDMYKTLGLAGRKTLFIMDKPAKNFLQAARNIPGAGWSLAGNLNAYEVLHHDFLIFTVAGVGAMVDYLKEAK